MACGDVLSLEDLQTAKKHQIFEAEVITGKAGGVAGGAAIDYATNQVTGQVQKTMPAAMRDLGFEPASFDFTTGGTLTTADRNKAVLWPLASGGDGDWYYWEGALPKVIPADSTPASTGGIAEGAWRPVGDITLRGDLAEPSGASLIGFIQSGPDSDQRTAQDKMRERVSIADKGAVPGIDCTDAIIKALSSTPSSIIIPVGEWVATPTTEDIHSVLALLSRVHADGNLLISAPAGTATGTTPAVCNISGSGNISVVGAEPTTHSITGFVLATGIAGAWDVVLQLNTVAGIAVGGFIHTTDATGTGAAAIHRGCWPVLAVNAGANQITVRNNCWKAAFPTHTITASTSKFISSVLKFNNCDGIYARQGQVFFDKVIIRGNAEDYWLSSNVSGTEKGTHGIYAGGPTVALNGKLDDSNKYALCGASVGLGPNVGVYDFDQQGILTELGGWVFGDLVSSCFNRRRGFYVSTASGIRAKHISSCGNFLDGILVDIGGQMYSSSSSCSAGNGQKGITSSSTGAVIFDSGLLVANVSDGASAVSGGMIQATVSTCIQNGGHGFFAEYHGTIYCNNSNVSDNTSNGIYGSVESTFRATNCTISNNGLFGVRSDLGADINYQGSTISGNTSGEVTLGADAKILRATRFGGTVYGDNFRARNIATGNGIQVTSSSGGDSVVFSYDPAAANSYTVAYTLANNSNGFYPASDGTPNLGRVSNRWNTIFATTGTINTSDGREKTAPLSIDDAVLDAWGDVQLITFQWLESIRLKGDEARWHFGVIAQQVRDAFLAHGLDGTRYGLLCYDEWGDEIEEVFGEDGEPAGEMKLVVPAGSRWGIRPDQCLFLEAAYQRRRCDRIEARLSKAGI